DFEWPVAESYRYQPPEKSPAYGSGTLAAGGKRYGFLVASGPTIIRRPLDGKGAFLKILLSGKPVREIAVQAAATYGMLTGQSKEGETEPLGLWRQLIDEIKQLQEFADTGALQRHGFSIGARFDV